MRIPKVFETGQVEQRNWFIREFVEGVSLGKENNKGDSGKLINNFQDYLERTVDLLIIFKDIKISLPNDHKKEFQYYQKTGQHPEIITKGAVRTSQEIGMTLPVAYAWIKENPFLKLGFTYYDYKPRHFFINDEQMTLIDAEWTNNIFPIHFDFSNYFTHLITIYQQEKVALSLLKSYVSKTDNRQEFWSYFKSLVSMIAIGEFKDAIKRKNFNRGHRYMLDLIEKRQIEELERKFS